MRFLFPFFFADSSVNAGSLIIQETPDSFIATGHQIVEGFFYETTEPADMFISLHNDVIVAGALAAKEQQDGCTMTVAMNGQTAILGTMAISERPDTAAAHGTIAVYCTMATTEPQDTASITAAGDYNGADIYISIGGRFILV